ncbi:hypothetical protein [Fretibacter rubidus]|uniref:hypothetical protein n=1 Tax=Fretibacter rubidus TaxID=570162 RepID=UPI00352B9412
MSDYDKQQWQAEQAARDAALEKQRDKERKARERSARNAKRKLERLHKKLEESGDLTDWEDEFAGSVRERLDEFGSAFNDREKGRPGDALSFAQKRVVASLNKKVKDAKRAAQDRQAEDGNSESESESRFKPRRSSFKSKKNPKFQPRVRHIEDDFEDAPPPELTPPKKQPFIPKFAVEDGKASKAETPPEKPKAKRPFLRIVKNDGDGD